MVTKKCRICKQVKPATLEYYHKESRTHEGLRHQCKICDNKRRASQKVRKRPRPTMLPINILSLR